MTSQVKNQVLSVLKNLEKKDLELLSKVLLIEREKLHLEKPRGIKEELLKAVKEVIK
ncbi:hypothetical protein Dalk_4793 [Desulfatibacillum aliphaticivorans]|uniref:Uncharacterized protein n=1 Tax=Desulfatibacillum aliphaticivorans TaxID=218208 RepID=B8FD39_DESAL|nr:hypothetical protein [Desulfatibacillum aliphaticivorans]ACL06470.1 hypothetical protein Dalk_4793 [Desulfatibacillum aliphaticivorans]